MIFDESKIKSQLLLGFKYDQENSILSLRCDKSLYDYLSRNKGQSKQIKLLKQYLVKNHPNLMDSMKSRVLSDGSSKSYSYEYPEKGNFGFLDIGGVDIDTAKKLYDCFLNLSELNKRKVSITINIKDDGIRLIKGNYSKLVIGGEIDNHINCYPGLANAYIIYKKNPYYINDISIKDKELILKGFPIDLNCFLEFKNQQKPPFSIIDVDTYNNSLFLTVGVIGGYSEVKKEEAESIMSALTDMMVIEQKVTLKNLELVEKEEIKRKNKIKI